MQAEVEVMFWVKEQGSAGWKVWEEEGFGHLNVDITMVVREGKWKILRQTIEAASVEYMQAK